MLKPSAGGLRASLIAAAVVLGLGYFACAELGHALSLKSQDQHFATFWPAAGLLLAMLVRAPGSRWPILLLAAGLANLTSDVLLHSRPVLVGLGFCLANCGEACIGALLLRWVLGQPVTLTRLKEVLALAGLSATLGPVFGATIGVTVVILAGSSTSFWSAWQIWWIADAVGVLLVGPLVLAWSGLDVSRLRGVRPQWLVEGLALFAGLNVVAVGVYGDFLPPALSVPILILPFLLWAGMRFGPRGAAAALVLVALVGVWNTSQGRGPYMLLDTRPAQHILRTQVTLGIISLSVLVLAVIVTERQQAEIQRITLIGELEQALAEIKTLRGLIPVCAWCKNVRNDQGFWQRLEDYLHAHADVQVTHGICPVCMEKQVALLKEVE